MLLWSFVVNSDWRFMCLCTCGLAHLSLLTLSQRVAHYSVVVDFVVTYMLYSVYSLGETYLRDFQKDLEMLPYYAWTGEGMTAETFL